MYVEVSNIFCAGHPYQQVDDVNENEETFRFHVSTQMILIAHLND